MAIHPDKAVDVTLATLVLHNMLHSKSAESYMPDIAINIEASDGSVTGGSWRNDNSIDFTRSLPATNSEQDVCETFADHFYGHGQIPWQWNIVV